MSPHTPGPWRFTLERDGECLGIRAGEDTSVVGGCGCCGSPWCSEADARLIAAAPDLLAALREMVDVHEEPCRIDHNGRCQSHFLDDVNNGGCRVANAKAAVAKATGESL